MTRLEHGSNVACGGGPMVAVMKAARALGAPTGDRAALRGQRRRGRARPQPRGRLPRGRALPAGAVSAPLSDHGRRCCSRSRGGRSRATSRARRSSRRCGEPELLQPLGAFVTLKTAGRGAARLHRPRDAGGAARRDGRARRGRGRASEDPRFGPVTRDELDALRLEVSVLSAYEPIAPDAVEVGRHGLLVRGHGTMRPAAAAGRARARARPRGVPRGRVPQGGAAAGRLARSRVRALRLHRRRVRRGRLMRMLGSAGGAAPAPGRVRGKPCTLSHEPCRPRVPDDRFRSCLRQRGTTPSTTRHPYALRRLRPGTGSPPLRRALRARGTPGSPARACSSRRE